jgi:hypothetical protein
MYAFYRCSCYGCQAPLKISFYTNGTETDWLYTWLQESPLDLSLNTVLYKKVGSQIKRFCLDCEKSLSKDELVDWFIKGRKYVQTAERITAPLALTAVYWLAVPGLYLWFRPFLFHMTLLQSEGLGIQENAL